MAGVTHEIRGKHHNLTIAVVFREEKNTTKLSNTIKAFTNPFSQDGADLFNLVTKVVLPEEVKDDLCNQIATCIGFKLFTVFVKELIQTGKENLWSPMKKQKLLTWKTTGKNTKVTVDNKVVELQEDRCLFARMHDDGMQVASRDQHSRGSWSLSVFSSASTFPFCVGWLNAALLYEECINERYWETR